MLFFGEKSNGIVNLVRKKTQKYIKVAGKTTSTIAKVVRKTYLCKQNFMYHA